MLAKNIMDSRRQTSGRNPEIELKALNAVVYLIFKTKK